MKMNTLLPSFMLFACTFQTIALNSETQNTIIKLEQSVISVGQLITQIENQTDYLVVFKSREVDIERYITVQNTSGKMISYLEEAFKDTDITYEFDNRYILLLKKNDKGRTSLIGQQSRTITGTVTDNNGEPVIGANVIIKGTSIGTVTDVNGKYTLEVPPKAILQISYIGYLTKEIVIDNNKTADVILIEDTQKIDEVVVVGYGTQKKGEVASSISTIKSDNFVKTPTTDAAQLIKGKVPGLSIITPDANPTSTSQIALRGITTLKASSSPLVLIDGIPGDLNSVSPDDIEQIDVLKDGSAAAIYGTRGTNGVILITTKNANGEMPTEVDVNAYLSTQQITKTLPFMKADEYRRRVQEGWPGAQDDGASTDWLDEVTRTPFTQIYNISLRGGSRTTNYVASFEYRGLNGLIKRTNNQMFYPRVEITHRMFNNKLKLNASLSGYKQTYFSGSDGGGYNSEVYRNALIYNPTTPVYDKNGNYSESTKNEYFNPVSLLNEVEGENQATNLRMFANITYTPIEGLDIKYLFSSNTYNQVRGYYETQQHKSTWKDGKNGYASRGSTRSNEDLSELTVQWRKTIFEDHSFTLLGGYSWQKTHYQNFYMQNFNFPSNDYTYNNMGTGQALKDGRGTEYSTANESKLIGYFGRLNYNYDDRYLLTATLRADGSSSFAKESRWGWFPSVALAWKVNNEAFLKDVEAINSLKLRLGWGVVGNQWAGSYAYGVTMASAASIWGTGFYAGNYPNRELKWEETNSFNVGLDLALFNNRIEFIADAYYKKTDNLLMQASLPTYVSGLIRAPWVNAGAMTNKGVEFTLNTHNIQTRDFTWTSGLTFSINHNEVTKLYSESSAISGINGSETLTYTMVGEPVGQFYGYKVIGMFKEEGDFYKKGADGNFLLDETGNRIQVAIPKDQTIGKSGIWVGDYIYEDRDNNGVIDEKDRTFLGNPAPKFTFGFNNYLSYKGFDLNIFLNGSVGNKAINLIRRTFTDPMRNSNLLKEATGIAQIAMHDPEVGDEVLSNVYVANADAAKVQRITTSSANDNNRISDRFVEDASYLRIKNISLGYTFPQKWLRRLQIDHLRLYVNIQNLCTITGYKGYDPEIGALNYNVLLRGVDDARYPSQRIYTFGLNFNF